MSKSYIILEGALTDENGESLIPDSINQKKSVATKFLADNLADNELLILIYNLDANELETKEHNLEAKRHHLIAAKMYDYFVYDKPL